MNLKFYAFCAITTLLATAATAQEKVGTAVVDGRTVTLFSDNSWQFEAAKVGSCENIAKTIHFCPPQEWKRTPAPSPLIAAQFMQDATHYYQFISEQLGRSHGLDHDRMIDLVLQGTAGSLGKSVEDIPILGVSDATVSGKPGRTVSYGFKFNGLDIVFANTVMIGDTTTLQLQSYVIGETSYTENHAQRHADFLSKVELKDEQ